MRKLKQVITGKFSLYVSRTKSITILLTTALLLTLTACGGVSKEEHDRLKQEIDELKSVLDEKLEEERLIEQNKAKEEEAKEYLRNNFESFKIDGSSSMIPLHKSLNDLLCNNETYVHHNRTVNAFDKFINGRNDILLSVDFSQELLDLAANSGVKLAKREITREAFVFLINKNNPVRSLTIDEIKGIYSGKITNWKEVGGDDAPIKAFQRNNESGSQIRMNMLMGDTPLAEVDVKYFDSMGGVIEEMAKFDTGKYSIAYNMYTFTEKQFNHEDVQLLAVNGINPTDETIFDDSYPIVIYNYLWYDENNHEAAEFAEFLYVFLMSEAGQKLISESGYINLNTKLDRNNDTHDFWDSDDYSELFYNRFTGEFYALDFENGSWEEGFELLSFANYPDYVLRDAPEHNDNAKVNEFIMAVYNSILDLRENTLSVSEDSIHFRHHFNAVFEHEDFFNFRYKGQYFKSFEYNIAEDKFILTACSQDNFDSYFTNASGTNREWAEAFSEYAEGYVPDLEIEITFEDLKDLYIRDSDSYGGLPLVYIDIFR